MSHIKRKNKKTYKTTYDNGLTIASNRHYTLTQSPLHLIIYISKQHKTDTICAKMSCCHIKKRIGTAFALLLTDTQSNIKQNNNK